ncbi:MAG: ABC transporter permease [Deltaproteobacteria bacterium]|nr:ABC transporter permease [Deltaproteobacteria bacterium]MBW2086628.1 ABC transporter permease [Deltaproteobacteria bacterium]
MQRFIIIRIIQSFFIILGVLVFVFILGRVGANDPAILMAGPDAEEEDIEEIRRVYGLDKPVIIQLGYFFRELAKGNFGRSYNWDQPALSLVLSRFPATIKLSLVAFFMVWTISICLGILSAVKRGTWVDTITRVYVFSGQSIPNFWFALILILIFGVKLGVLPTSGYGGLRHIILPAIALGLFGGAGLTRLTRSGMINVLDSEYIKMARAKGLRERTVLFKHALKNGAIPLVTLMGPLMAGMFSGSLIIELVFAWPGIGRLTYQAVLNSDFPVVQCAVFISTTLLVFGNLAVDIIYVLIDPRIRSFRRRRA